MPNVHIAYLTSVYPRASDSFIRGEIAALRRQGLQVNTFAIRPPGSDQLVSDAIRLEAQQTQYLLDGGKAGLLVSFFKALILLFSFSPVKVLSTLKFAWQLRWPGIKGTAWPVAYLLEAVLLAKHLRKHKIRQLHNHIGENSASVALLAATLTGIPYSLTIHGPYEFDAPVKFGLKLKIRQAKFIAAITNYTKAQLSRWINPEDRAKIQIVHCAVQPEFLNSTPTNLPEQTRLISVGRLCPEKGQWVLVEALHLLREKGVSVPLTFIGDGPSRGEIESAIKHYHLEDQINLAGWQSSVEVQRAIEQSTALVLPSFAEGLPVVIMEALALGRPVITTYIAGIPELVCSQKNGWLVPAGDISRLAEAIESLLSCSTQKLQHMGNEGRSAILTQHHPDLEAKKLAALFTV